MIKHTLPPDHNHTTRKFPRSLQEAFPDDYHAFLDETDSLVIAVCVVALVVLVTLIASGH